MVWGKSRSMTVWKIYININIVNMTQTHINMRSGCGLCFLFIVIVPQNLPEPFLPDVLEAVVALSSEF